MENRQRTIITIQNRINEARNKHTRVATVFISTLSEALALLKEHGTKNTGKARIFQCEKCGYGIDDIYLSNENDFDIYPHFCPNCGRSVMRECLQNR